PARADLGGEIERGGPAAAADVENRLARPWRERVERASPERADLAVELVLKCDPGSADHLVPVGDLGGVWTFGEDNLHGAAPRRYFVVTRRFQRSQTRPSTCMLVASALALSSGVR